MVLRSSLAEPLSALERQALWPDVTPSSRLLFHQKVVQLTQVSLVRLMVSPVLSDHCSEVRSQMGQDGAGGTYMIIVENLHLIPS